MSMDTTRFLERFKARPVHAAHDGRAFEVTGGGRNDDGGERLWDARTTKGHVLAYDDEVLERPEAGAFNVGAVELAVDMALDYDGMWEGAELLMDSDVADDIAEAAEDILRRALGRDVRVRVRATECELD